MTHWIKIPHPNGYDLILVADTADELALNPDLFTIDNASWWQFWRKGDRYTNAVTGSSIACELGVAVAVDAQPAEGGIGVLT